VASKHQSVTTSRERLLRAQIDEDEYEGDKKGRKELQARSSTSSLLSTSVGKVYFQKLEAMVIDRA
jgi:hypothetical protein